MQEDLNLLDYILTFLHFKQFLLLRAIAPVLKVVSSFSTLKNNKKLLLASSPDAVALLPPELVPSTAIVYPNSGFRPVNAIATTVSSEVIVSVCKYVFAKI